MFEHGNRYKNYRYWYNLRTKTYYLFTLKLKRFKAKFKTLGAVEDYIRKAEGLPQVYESPFGYTYHAEGNRVTYHDWSTGEIVGSLGEFKDFVAAEKAVRRHEAEIKASGLVITSTN